MEKCAECGKTCRVWKNWPSMEKCTEYEKTLRGLKNTPSCEWIARVGEESLKSGKNCPRREKSRRKPPLCHTSVFQKMCIKKIFTGDHSLVCRPTVKCCIRIPSNIWQFWISTVARIGPGARVVTAIYCLYLHEIVRLLEYRKMGKCT